VLKVQQTTSSVDTAAMSVQSLRTQDTSAAVPNCP